VTAFRKTERRAQGAVVVTSTSSVTTKASTAALRRAQGDEMGVDTGGGVWYRLIAMVAKRAKKSGLSAASKADVLNRLKTVRGMTDGIHKMVDEDVYCMQVLKQISAARASLDRVARILLQNHVATCFVAQVKAGETDGAVTELMETLNFQRELI
jgi:DNA-binding FrmR family transcriptional regulator